MYKYILCFLLLFTSLIGFSQNETKTVQTFTVETVPDPKKSNGGFVSDPSNYLTTSEKTSLNRLIVETEQITTAQIAVVILPSIGSAIPKDFAVDLFQHWGIGQSDKDNGLLILTVMDQRRTEFETGYGLEGVLPDIVLFRIGRDQVVPYFKKQEYGNGLIAAVSKIKSIVENPKVREEIKSTGLTIIDSDDSYRRSSPNPVIYVIIAYFICCILMGLLYRRSYQRIHNNKEDFYNKYIAIDKFNALFLAILFPLPFIFIRKLIHKRMNLYRYHPRFSKINGKPMVLKSEVEDDHYLYEGELKEEEIDSVDYDVWCTENDDDILILPYKNHTTPYSKCPKCTFKTYKLMHSRTVSYATYSSTGIKRKGNMDVSIVITNMLNKLQFLEKNVLKTITVLLEDRAEVRVEVLADFLAVDFLVEVHQVGFLVAVLLVDQVGAAVLLAEVVLV